MYTNWHGNVRYVHMTALRIIVGETCEFPTIVVSHQGLALKLILCLRCGWMTKTIQLEVMWCMLFVKDIMLSDAEETSKIISFKSCSKIKWV